MRTSLFLDMYYFKSPRFVKKILTYLIIIIIIVYLKKKVNIIIGNSIVEWCPLGACSADKGRSTNGHGTTKVTFSSSAARGPRSRGSRGGRVRAGTCRCAILFLKCSVSLHCNWKIVDYSRDFCMTDMWVMIHSSKVPGLSPIPGTSVYRNRLARIAAYYCLLISFYGSIGHY